MQLPHTYTLLWMCKVWFKCVCCWFHVNHGVKKSIKYEVWNHIYCEAWKSLCSHILVIVKLWVWVSVCMHAYACMYMCVHMCIVSCIWKLLNFKILVSFTTSAQGLAFAFLHVLVTYVAIIREQNVKSEGTT